MNSKDFIVMMRAQQEATEKVMQEQAPLSAQDGWATVIKHHNMLLLWLNHAIGDWDRALAPHLRTLPPETQEQIGIAAIRLKFFSKYIAAHFHSMPVGKNGGSANLQIPKTRDFF